MTVLNHRSGMTERESSTVDGVTFERMASRLELAAAADVGRAVFEHAGGPAVRRYGRAATAAAALRVACRRTGRRPGTLESVAEEGVDVNAVGAAEALLEAELSAPAPPETRRALRRTLVVGHELLARVERGHAAAPRLPATTVGDVDPTLLALADRPLDEVDPEELRAHLRRLEADLEMAHLGTDLYALLYAAE